MELHNYIEEQLCNVGGVWHKHSLRTPLHRLCWRHLKLGYVNIYNIHAIKKVQRQNRYAYAISRQIKRPDYVDVIAFAKRDATTYFNAYCLQHTIIAITNINIAATFKRGTYFVVTMRDDKTCFGSVAVGELLRMGYTVYVK